MDKELLQILQHSLGLNRYGSGNQYRNHFVPGGVDLDRCRQLADMGFMNEFKPHMLSGNTPYFLVTKRGMEAVREFSPKEPVEKLTRSQKRYRSYLKED